MKSLIIKLIAWTLIMVAELIPLILTVALFRMIPRRVMDTITADMFASVVCSVCMFAALMAMRKRSEYIRAEIAAKKSRLLHIESIRGNVQRIGININILKDANMQTDDLVDVLNDQKRLLQEAESIT